MTDDRRYRDEEIERIFKHATTQPPAHGPASSGGDGLTLAELQEIGREAGISPQRITEAASALDRSRAATPRRSLLGMPISVGRNVDLPRAPSDREWEMLVGELRRTFRAHGRESSSGHLRSWTNGNLHAYVEPTESGYRLRLGTLKGDATIVTGAGIGGMLLGVLVLGVSVLSGGPAELGDSLIVAGLGAAAVAYNALRLPHWARKRDEQMQHIANRARALIASEPDRAITRESGSA